MVIFIYVKTYLCKEADMLIVTLDGDGDYYDVKTYLCKEAGTRPHWGSLVCRNGRSKLLCRDRDRGSHLIVDEHDEHDDDHHDHDNGGDNDGGHECKVKAAL